MAIVAVFGVLLAFISLSCTGNSPENVQSTEDDGTAGPGRIERQVDLTPVLAAADRIVRTAVDDEMIAGAVLMIGLGGETFHDQAFGYAQRYEFGRVPMSDPPRMTVEHVFDLASLTKVFATTFGMMLYCMTIGKIFADVRHLGGDGGIIALDSTGRIETIYNSEGMKRASVDSESGVFVATFD